MSIVSENEIKDKKKEFNTTNNNRTYLIEIIVFSLFVIFSVIMFLFHELWYDEIQAYVLAKDASWIDLLFKETHLEGHPPLFSALLAIFAKTGVPMKIGVRLVSLPFSLVGAYLVIFKAPFKKWIRCLIPFTFFIFYQYTVICRPYSMMFAAFMLAALFYKTRNEKPVRYILSLALLCWCSTYGMLFAGCFCAIWVFEIIFELKGKEFFKKVIKDKRFWCLWGILFNALLIIYLIYPKGNVFGVYFHDKSHPIKCLIYTLFMMPADSMVTDVGFFGSLQDRTYQFMRVSALTIGAVFMTIVILSTVYFVAYVHKKRRMLIFPFLAFAFYAAFGYLCNHHIGINVLFIVFLMWICYDNGDEQRELPKFITKLEAQYKDISKKIAWLVLIICLGMSMLWTVMSCFNDITHTVWYAEEVNDVIERYNLSEYRIVADWPYYPVNNGKIDCSLETLNLYGDMTEEEINNSPYFYHVYDVDPDDFYQVPIMANFADIVAFNSKGENYISNFNDGDDNKRYINHDCMSREDAAAYAKKLGELGYPDIIIGDPNIITFMGLDIKETEYYPIYAIQIFRPYKYFLNYQCSYIYLRKDLWNDREKWPISYQKLY